MPIEKEYRAYKNIKEELQKAGTKVVAGCLIRGPVVGSPEGRVSILTDFLKFSEVQAEDHSNGSLLTL